MKHWTSETEIDQKKILGWIGLAKPKYYDWKDRYGVENEHNGKTPRDFWLEEWEKSEIIEFFASNPLNGYRRLCYMMNDANILAVSPSTVRNVLKSAGLLDRRKFSPSRKGTGFDQPTRPHQHWHVDITYVNIAGTFYYLASVLDGYSRAILHWDIATSMRETDIEIIIQQAKEKYGPVSPRIISDNGPQFVAKDFKEFIRLSGMTHVRTSPFYPQSNGKIEAMHKSLKIECIRPKNPRSVDEARIALTEYIRQYNEVRLHSGIGYVAPFTKLAGKELEVFRQRDERIVKARLARKLKRQAARQGCVGSSEDATFRDEKSSPGGATSTVITLGVEPHGDEFITSGNLRLASEDRGSDTAA